MSQYLQFHSELFSYRSLHICKENLRSSGSILLIVKNFFLEIRFYFVLTFQYVAALLTKLFFPLLLLHVLKPVLVYSVHVVLTHVLL